MQCCKTQGWLAFTSLLLFTLSILLKPLSKLNALVTEMQNYFSSAFHYSKGALSRQKAFHHKAEELNALQSLDLSDILEPLPKEMCRKVFAVFFHSQKLVLTIEYHPGNYIIQ